MSAMDAASRSAIGLAFVFCLVLLLAGCATGPKIDWNARIGNYTYDQAVTEMGPPDKMARLTDGTIVSEWLAYRSAPGAYVEPYPFFYPRGYLYPGFAHVDTYPSYETFLRLTFSPDGRLTAWRKYTR